MTITGERSKVMIQFERLLTVKGHLIKFPAEDKQLIGLVLYREGRGGQKRQKRMNLG